MIIIIIIYSHGQDEQHAQLTCACSSWLMHLLLQAIFTIFNIFYM